MIGGTLFGIKMDESGGEYIYVMVGMKLQIIF
jgi:hypothetical protein